jgi:phosphoribosylformylglycinamidine (FGAM) synthase-like enzyme
VEVELEKIPEKGCRRIDELLFSESYARFLIATPRRNVKELLRIAAKNLAPAAAIGRVVDKDWFKLKRGGEAVVDCSVEEMGKRWREALPKAMGAV